MKTSPNSEDRKRLVWISCFLFVLFSLLIVQFYKIQIIESEKWTKEAKAQHQLVVVEPFKRGIFYSNTSIKTGHPEKAQPFVIDVPKFHLFIDPQSIPESSRDEVAGKIAVYLQLPVNDLEKVRQHFNKASRSRKLVMWINRDKRDQILQWWFKYAREKKIARNALFFVQDYKRSYPFGKLLGQVLHTVREERDVKTDQWIPTGGLEMQFDDVLRGTPGKRVILRSPRHPLDTGKVFAHPEHGADIYLTINHYLQAICEEEIEKAVKKANAKGGWAILMEPRTGEILAWAQFPFFDPSDYRKFYNDSKLLDNTKVKAITDPYEPGSTFKALTLAICLKANAALKLQGKKPILYPEEKVATGNGMFPGRSKPVRDTSYHKFLNMELAIQKSSNIYLARMVQRIIEHLGVDWYRGALEEFGFGLKSGIELPAEASGLLPTPGKLHPNGTLEWSVPTPFSLAFGYNLLVNSMQMLRAYAIIANGGYDVKPTLVRKIVKTRRDGSQEVLLDNTTADRIASFKKVLDPEISAQVIETMKLVTKPGGSASKGDIYGYTEAGKTGTSEKIINGTYSKKDHFSSFIGFAPAKNPRFVLMIAIDEPEYKFIPGIGRNQMGGNCSAPAFREIGARALEYLGVEPDDPYGYPVGDPRSNLEKADMMPKIKRLKELYQQWNN